MRRRIDIEADDIPQFADEVRIPGELELAHPMRLRTVIDWARYAELFNYDDRHRRFIAISK